MQMKKVVALVPMKEHSERVPNKNIRDFCGRPLYHHILKSLEACPYISQIYIDTDSTFIANEAPKHFDVQIIDRPLELRSDFTPTNEIILYDLSITKGEYFLQTHSTNPLLRTETITRAIEKFLHSLPKYDSLFSVTRLQTRLWDANGRPINHDLDILLRTQDLPPIYEENSNMYIFTRETMEKRRNRIGEQPLMFEMDRVEACDIDEEIDFQIAEFLYLERQKSSQGAEI
ncbi:MAG: acylneuraminate cytidylyltransferase family protein [Methanophagales archaeon]|nr:acylneuraminate cytidylyltransferase family protein [Methanophagales archaeon]